MDKREILSILQSAIVEASPCAAYFLSHQDENKIKETFFVDLGVNSIDYAEITNIVMNKLNIEHSLDIFTKTNRISDVVEIFYDLVLEQTKVPVYSCH